MARSLALDVGNRRVGVALSDASKLLARPLMVIDRKAEDAVARIDRLTRENGVDEIVIGLPFHADGKVSTQAELVRAFGETVAEALVQLPVIVRYVDERYSTQDAKAIIAENRKKKQPMHDDAVAAAVILQRHLDQQREQMAEDTDAMDDVFDE